jgi:hypothetical protein
MHTSNPDEGLPINALDYERLQFQMSRNSRLLLATYRSGAVGVTFTAAGAVIFADLPPRTLKFVRLFVRNVVNYARGFFMHSLNTQSACSRYSLHKGLVRSSGIRG